MNTWKNRFRFVLPLLATASAAVAAPLKPVPFTDVHLNDAFWSPRVQTNLRSTLPHNLDYCESTGRLRNFDRAAGKLDGEFEGLLFNDSDVYKVLEGAAYTLAQKRDPSLEKRVDGVIDRIVAAQQPDGYLYTYYTVRKELDKRHTNEAVMHETYCAGHMIEAAVAYFQATGKRKFLDSAIRLADYYDGVYGPGKRRDATGHQEIELALVKLYNLTGEKRYFDLAKFFVEERGHPYGGRSLQGEYSQDHLPVREHREIQGHAVRAMYLYCGVTDLAAITNDPGYIRTLDSIWHDVVDRKMYVTGGLGPSGSNEGFTTAYDLPNDSAYAETCAAIALALWSQRMAILHRDARYADVTERAMYNGLLSGVSLAGNRFFYVNPLGSRGRHHRTDWFACACCPPNVVRLVPTVAGYAYATTDNDIYVNHFMGSDAKMTVGKTPVRITQTTRYPWDGNVRLALSPARSAPFTLRIRVPGWVQGPTSDDDLYRLPGKPAKGAVSVKVNGKPLTAFNIAKGYVTLQRTWKPGDVVEYTMPMPVRRVYAHPSVKQDIGKVALQRGPVVYCVEDADNPGYARRLAVPKDAPISATMRPEMLGGVTVLKGAGLAQIGNSPAAKAEFTAIPYFAWDNREAGGMALWLPESEKDLPVIQPPTVATRSKLTWSYTHADASAPNDGLVPRSSNDPETSQMDWWPHNGTTEWLQYDFPAPTSVSGTEVYWFQDHPGGGCAVPASWHVEYREGGAWKPVTGASAYGVEKDRLNRVTFNPVKTDALRLVVTSQENLSAGLYEWRVMESNPMAAKMTPLAVGLAQIGTESAWRTAETNSIRQEAGIRGIDLRVSDAQQRQEIQIKALRAFIAQKVDAIILAPVVETGWESVLKEAKAANIPVFLADRGIEVSDPSLYVTMVASDLVEEGRIAGRWLVKTLDGKGNVVELTGVPGSAPADDRAKGFREAIAGFPEIKIIESQTGFFTRAGGRSAMRKILATEGAPIQAVYAHNDDMALGAIEGIEAVGQKPGKDIVIVSIDGVKGAFAAMKAGKLNATVEFTPLLGPALFDAIEAHRDGKTLAKRISVEDRLYEQHEAEKLLPTREY